MSELTQAEAYQNSLREIAEGQGYIMFKQLVESGNRKAVDWNWFTAQQITEYTERLTKELTNE